jgi:hypothetical protein
MRGGLKALVIAAPASLLIACVHARPPIPAAREAERTAEPPITLAQACSPGMSCFGKVVLLPSGEVAGSEAAIEAAATAAMAVSATVGTKTDSKATPKETEKEKAEPRVQPRTKQICELVGASVKQPNKKLRCTYHCPGDPPGVTREVFLDIPECPRLWDFYP